ncbi:hypothetical protein [Streptomyces sp. BA2]|uniref:hypothetical protein n=1 Tax=Streptomyces sp. BA2 TaxID=436595 RepID=UPI001324F7E9|nr:hypothetical protein [Streptomyces sp. BA2]MWA07797.1 hypothetical protein [Streptomyces sp. BA2]
MSRLARTLCSLHAALFVLLAFCAVQQFRYGDVWAAFVFAAASIVPVLAVARETELAVMRETELANGQRAVVNRLERATRRRWSVEDAAALARVELAAACCERWWTSAGQSHETTCRTYDHRSAA